MKDKIIILSFMLFFTAMIGKNMFIFGESVANWIMVPILLILMIIDIVILCSIIICIWREEFKE